MNSVHEANWQPTPFNRTNEEKFNWNELFAFRVPGLSGLEGLRRNKLIGKSLEASVIAVGDRETIAPIIQLTDEFKELLGVSELLLDIVDKPGKTELSFSYSPVVGHRQKCERCWHWETDVGRNSEHPTLCGRCVEAVLQFKA